MMVDLSDRMIDIVRQLETEGRLGERTKGPTKKDELRFGGRGSLSIMVGGTSRGDWYDHERQEGGGPWDLIKIRGGYDGDRAKAWLRDKLGIETDDGSGILATYDYTDERGVLLFQVVRYPNHKFLQRRPDGNGGWTWKLGNTRRVLYRLPEVLAAKASRNGHPWRVYLCEGEKDVDRLRRDWNVVATTNAGGAVGWDPKFDVLFAGSEVILLEDNDEAGQKRTAKLAPQLTRAGAIVKVVRFPHLDKGGDVSDWLDDGGLQSDMETAIEQIEPFQVPGAGIPNPSWFDPKILTLAHWLERDDVAPPDFLLGEVLSTTSRVLMFAPTGLGKTNLGLAAAMAIADGRDFLHWRGHRPAKVLYIDGEMSRRLMKQRLIDAVRRHCNKPTNLFIVNREDFPDLPPLNTEEGQQYVDAIIELLGGVDIVFFDNIQSLLGGDMKEEEPWQQTLPWVRDLTQRKIGQLWVHHTGHDENKSYGTKTREWQLDTVMQLQRLERAGTDIAFTLSFPKARERTPDNRSDFADAVITLANDEWNSESGGGDRAGRGRKRTLDDFALEMLDEALAKTGTTPLGFTHIPPDTCCATVDMWKRYFQHNYVGEATPESVEKMFYKLASKLQVEHKIGVEKPWIWRVG
jgi:hypothetical protein